MTTADTTATRTALVTGGLGAIGGVVVDQLRARGVRVCVIDVTDRSAVFDPDYEQCDLGDLDAIDQLAEALTSRYAGFDMVVHCAGITQDDPLAKAPRAQWLRVLAVNLTGPIALTQALIPTLRPDGSMVFISSGTIFKGTPGHSAYVASKGGLVAFARTMARELGDAGIRVNCVAPGLTATPLVDNLDEREPAQIASRALKRREVSEDVSGAILFLLSDDSKFISGQTIVVDGGSVMH